MKLLQIFQEFILNFNIIFLSNIGPKVIKDQARENFKYVWFKHKSLHAVGVLLGEEGA